MKIAIRFIVAAGIALAFSLPGTAQVRTPEEQPASTVLRNVRIVDVYSGTVSELQDYAGASQAVVSQQLAALKARGIVDARRAGTFVYYRIVEPKVYSILDCIRACNLDG